MTVRQRIAECLRDIAAWVHAPEPPKITVTISGGLVAGSPGEIARALAPLIHAVIDEQGGRP